MLGRKLDGWSAAQERGGDGSYRFMIVQGG